MLTARILFTTFTVLLLVVITLGWHWTATHQPPHLSTASHVVLGVSACFGLFAIVKIWSPRR